MTAPVDAAPPKDPDEIEGLVEDAMESAWRDGDGQRETYSDRTDAARAAVLSAVASLRERAEEAEREAERQRNLWESIRDARVAAAESSLERMRERVAGLAEAARSLLHAWDGPAAAVADRDFDQLRSALRSLDPSPSTPETKDDARAPAHNGSTEES